MIRGLGGCDEARKELITSFYYSGSVSKETMYG
jgi:hypothetical protein